MLRNLKLGSKFILSMMAISIVPLAVVSFYYYFNSKSELEKKTVGSLRAVNDSRAAHINHLIQLRQEQAKSMAGTYIIRQLREDGFTPPEVIRIIQGQIESVFHEIKARSNTEYQYIDQESDVEIISVWDIHGNIVANTNRSLIGKKEPFEFLHILYEKGAYFKGFEIDPLTGEKYLTILEGVRNWDSGEYAGVILLKTSAKIINDITTARKGLGKTAETYLVDKKFRMITESRFVKDAVLNLTVKTKGTEACFSQQETTVVYKDYQDRDVLGVYKYLPDQQWCLVTEIDAEEAFSPVIAFRNQILAVVGCLIILIIFLVRMAGRIFIGPIVELRNASQEVARGNYNVRVTPQSQDELGELTKAFADMTKDLSNFTTELQEKNKILEKQKTELKKLDELKSEFVSTVSHELRTPMTIIKESITQLLDGLAEGSVELQKRLLTMALSNVSRLANLINNLLDLSKIEAGKVELHREMTDIINLAREVCYNFEPQVKKKGLELRQVFSKDTIEISIDREKIIQVFINLIGNSLKFVEKGFVEVSVTEEDHQVVCSIADSGNGISKDDLQKVFNKFQQFGRKDGPGVKGTGLGLSICKGIVDLHQGRIWVESELGQGTKFAFTLPKT